MELTYYCSKCEKELCFNINSNRHEEDKVGYIHENIVLCNSCYNSEVNNK